MVVLKYFFLILGIPRNKPGASGIRLPSATIVPCQMLVEKYLFRSERTRKGTRAAENFGHSTLSRHLGCSPPKVLCVNQKLSIPMLLQTDESVIIKQLHMNRLFCYLLTLF